MKRIIQFRIYKGEKYYIGEGVDLPVVTQGSTIDETAENIKEALTLYLKGEKLSELGFGYNPPVLVNFEIEPTYA